jgi:hypothetical protein
MAGMAFGIHVWAALAIGLTVALTVFMDWVPTPLNRDILVTSPRQRLPGTVLHTLLGALFVAANLLEVRLLIGLGAAWYTVALVAAVRTWWQPYITGVTRGELDADTYDRLYARNVRVLPRIRDHAIVPDLQHMLIHATLALATVLSWASSWPR